MENWEKVKQLYQAALGKDAVEQAVFLDEACAGDEALRREVQSLLAYQEEAEPFMEAPAIEVAATTLIEDPDIRLVGRKLSHYQVLSLLGAGGMGEVYLAQDPRLDRKVALKILPPDMASDADRMQRFMREARAASALNHANVATVYDVGEDDGVCFIAMEYVEGQTLAEKIGGRPVDPAEIIDVGGQVADALEAAHVKEITHRDIKPANLMITARGQVKVLDFGVAKMAATECQALTNETSAGSKTVAGIIVGSVPHMSPEQVLGREVDHRSDIFSLGIALYEMATGRLPFVGATKAETMDLIQNAQPEPIALINDRVPSELERIIGRCLEKDVERRYQSARDVLVDLRNLKRDTDAQVAVREARRDNLPVQLTSFIGRQREIAAIRRLFLSTRLLTLTGAGGCGKTRLALQVAADLLEQFRDGVWVVDLAPLSEPDLVPQSAASVLKVQEGPNRSLVEVLSDYVRPRQLLLVLDNCEHLITACAELAETLLRAGTGLHILATSREAMGISGETVWHVPSLSLPEQAQALSPEVLLEYEAVRLFVERAAAVEPTFAITNANTATVAEICHRLDGIPLAIELAAARLKVLSVEEINVRLKDRFRLLTGGSRTAVARQRTLEATVDWSYDLLTEVEQRLLRRLSVFTGGWTLEAAEDVCSGEGVEKDEILEPLSRLVDKSLVNVEEGATGNRRYRFLETVRQYGQVRLVRSGEAERLRELHLAFFFELAQRAEPELQRPDQVIWLNRLQLEHDNLRAALDWCLAAPRQGDKGLELAAALFWFWTKRGCFGEGRQWLARVLSVDTRRSAALRAKALIGLSHMTFFLGDYAGTGEYLEESLALGRQAEDIWAVSFSLLMQSALALAGGNLEGTAELAAEARAAAMAGGHLWLEGGSLMFLALCAQSMDDYERAGPLYEAALVRHRRTGDKWTIGMTLSNIAALRVLQGQYDVAKHLGAEAIRLNQELSDHRGTAWCLEAFAAAEAAQSEAARAAHLWGASDGLLEKVGSALPPSIKSFRDRYFDRARESLGDSAFQTALSNGRAMSLTQAVEYALEDNS
jgi:predicted ATPase/predicted Ser/Thr protein kinase